MFKPLLDGISIYIYSITYAILTKKWEFCFGVFLLATGKIDGMGFSTCFVHGRSVVFKHFVRAGGGSRALAQVERFCGVSRGGKRYWIGGLC